MKKTTTALILLSFTGCGLYTTKYVDVPGPTVTATPSPEPVPSPTPTPTADEQEATLVQSLVDAENTYREGLGQTELSPGLSCNVQLLGSGQWLLSSSPGYNAGQGIATYLAGSRNFPYLLQTSFNVPDTAGNVVNPLIPTDFQAVFVNQNYKIVCSGNIVITQTDYYEFETDSDDGSIVLVNGGQVVNNDGNHGMTDKLGTPTYLRSGVYTFQVQYAQTGGGNFGLILSSNGSVLKPLYFLH